MAPKLFNTGLLWLGLVCGIAQADPAEESQKAYHILEENYVYAHQLSSRDKDHLDALLAHLHGGATLGPEVVPDSANISQFIQLNATDSIWYFRPAWQKSTMDGAADLARQANVQGARGGIIDLRDASCDDLELGRDLVDLLLPSNDVEFTVINPSRHASEIYPDLPGVQPLFTQPVVVLISGGTTGVPELVATLLHSHGAFLVGLPSAGSCGVFSQVPLGKNVLRYAVADILLNKGQTLLGHPLVPEIRVPISPGQEARLVAQIEAGSLQDLIKQPTNRPKMSEAALVRGENPTLDALASSSTDPAKSPMVDQDECMDQAIACLQTLNFIHRKPK